MCRLSTISSCVRSCRCSISELIECSEVVAPALYPKLVGRLGVDKSVSSLVGKAPMRGIRLGFEVENPGGHPMAQGRHGAVPRETNAPKTGIRQREWAGTVVGCHG